MEEQTRSRVYLVAAVDSEHGRFVSKAVVTAESADEAVLKVRTHLGKKGEAAEKTEMQAFELGDLAERASGISSGRHQQLMLRLGDEFEW